MADGKDEETQDVEAQDDQILDEERKADSLEELKEVLPKPHVDYVPD